MDNLADTSIRVSDFEAQNDFQETVLHAAAKHGHLDTVEKLVNELAKVKERDHQVEKVLNIQNSQGETVIHIVSRFSDLKNFRNLAEKGSDLKVQDSCGNTPMHILASSKNPSEKLKDFTVDIIELDNASFTKILEMQNKNGETVLHMSSKTCNIDYFEFLVKQGTNLEIQDKLGNTPLHTLVSAILLQYSELCRLGVTNTEDRKYTTEDVLEKLKFLLEFSERDKVLPIKNKEEETVLHLACRAGSVRLAKCLIDLGANVKDDEKGSNASLDKTEKLIKYVCDLEDETVKGLVSDNSENSQKENTTG